MIEVVALLVGLSVVSAVLTRCVQRVGERLRVLDVPNERSSHTRPIPRTGGVAMATVVLVGIAVLAAADMIAPRLAWAMLPAGFLIAVVGFVDDVRGVPAWIRLLAHMIGVGWFLMVSGGPPDFGIDLLERSDVARWAVTLIGFVWLLNLFNFMDGIDGLAASEAVFAPLGLIALAYWHQAAGSALTLPVIVAAAPLGFLRWNWPPARVFMGDAGSGLLGFMIGALVVIAAEDWGLSLAVSVILLGVFIVDSTTTLVRRILRGEKWYSAHRSHAYQKLSRRLGSHGATTSVLMIVNVVWLLPLAVLAAEFPQWSVLLVAVAMLPLLAAALWLRAGCREEGG